MSKRSDAILFASGFDFPEGPAFDRNGDLFLVNCDSGAVSKVTPEGEVSEFVNTGGIPVGLAFDTKGDLFVADSGVKAVLRIRPDGQVFVFVDRCGDEGFRGPNDLVFDPKGNLYFSDPAGSSLESPVGAVYRATQRGSVTRIDSDLAFPNGVAVSEDGFSLFVAETMTRYILRYEVSPDGSVGERAVFAQLSGGVGPDGMAFDAEGNLYVAHFGKGAVAVIDPEGTVVDNLPVPGKNPTNVCFGGPEFDTLFVTETETNSVYRIHVGVKGQRLYSDMA